MLVYHQPPKDGDTKEDWVGRTITMTLKPGTCNSLTLEQPQLSWKTMGGGTASEIETRSIGLLDIHSISSSVGDEARDDHESSAVEQDEMMCFFTITTGDGDVHVFESITSEESERLVNGIKNLVARFANQLILGDTSAFSEFYTNADEDVSVRFSRDEAMTRLSHSFFD